MNTLSDRERGRMAEADLFGYAKPRSPRRVMMHAIDAGQAPGMNPGWRTSMGAHFKCAQCGHDDGWSYDMYPSEVRRGLPCPNCNNASELERRRLAAGQVFAGESE